MRCDWCQRGVRGEQALEWRVTGLPATLHAAHLYHQLQRPAQRRPACLHSLRSAASGLIAALLRVCARVRAAAGLNSMRWMCMHQCWCIHSACGVRGRTRHFVWLASCRGAAAVHIIGGFV